MQSENRMFDDFVKVLNGAAGTFAGVGREAQSGVRERAREWLGGLDFFQGLPIRYAGGIGFEKLRNVLLEIGLSGRPTSRLAQHLLEKERMHT